MSNNKRQGSAGGEDERIGVTPEMIEAGVGALFEWAEERFPPNWPLAPNIVEKILLAAEYKRPKQRSAGTKRSSGHWG